MRSLACRFLVALAVSLPAPVAQAAAQTPITTCGYAITSPGDYVLAQDLVRCPGTDPVIRVDASDVDLSLGGHQIQRNPSAVAIHVGKLATVSGVTVSGPGTIIGVGDGYGNALVLDKASHSTVTGLKSTASDYGVRVISPAGLAGNRVLDNDLRGNRHGAVALTGPGSGVEVARNDCSDGVGGFTYGIVISNAGSNDVHDNVCNDGFVGIAVGTTISAANQIHHNMAVRNTHADGFDWSEDCGSNQWFENMFFTVSRSCIPTTPTGGPACTLSGTAGDDTLKGTPSRDVVCGLDGNDSIEGLGGDDLIRGGAGTDRIVGGPGDDHIDGGGGADTVLERTALIGVTVDLAAGTAADAFGGSDVLVDVEKAEGTQYADVLTGSDGPDTLDGRGGADDIHGGDGNDTVIGGAGADELDGQLGNDLLIPGPGGDVVSGGQGRDRVQYTDVTGGGVHVDLAAGQTTPRAGSNSGADSFTSIEDAFGSAFDDLLVGALTGVAGDLRGFGGDDEIRANDGDGLDKIEGGLGADTCLADAGDRRISC